MAYNFSALTNGKLVYSGVPNQLTPARGALNNNLELFWLDVDIGQDMSNTRAVLHVAVNDLLLFMDFANFNHSGNDAVNRVDQFARSPATFTIMEFTDTTNPKRPFPRDCNNANFENQSREFGKAKFQIDGKQVTMQMLDDYVQRVNN